MSTPAPGLARKVCPQCNGLVAWGESCCCEPHTSAVPTAVPVKLAPNPKQAYGAQKPNLALIPPVADLHMAMAFELGAAKYGAFNWRDKAVESMTYIAAARRHLGDWADGAELTEDGEGLVHNLAAVMACCAILLDALEQGNLIDNRPLPGASQQVALRLKELKAARSK